MKAWWQRFNYRRYVLDFTTGKASPVLTPREGELLLVLCGVAIGHGVAAVWRLFE